MNDNKPIDKNIKRIALRIIIALIALVLLVLGIVDGGFADIRNKAIMICYECMGIG